ncbi:hypothetical protein ACFL6T_00475 [Candidatus Zixiibacteriota bacterium]
METISMSRMSHGKVFPSLIIAVVLIMVAGCAASAPSLDQARIRNKLDLRLQGALGGRSIGETLGEFIQVSVRMKSEGLPEDLSLLALHGVPGQFLGSVTTLILRPSKIIDVAALSRVAFIELAARNVPNPTIPPPPPPAD